MKTLLIYLNNPGDRGDIKRLFDAHKQAGQGVRYEGAASLGVSGYEFSCHTAESRDAFLKLLGAGWFKRGRRHAKKHDNTVWVDLESGNPYFQVERALQRQGRA